MKSVGLIAVLLFAGGCSRHKPAPPAPKTVTAAEAPEATAEAPEQATPAEEGPAPTAKRAPTVAQPAAPGEIAQGMSREDLLDRLGGCADLVTLVPGGNGSRSVEVYEPDPSRSDCVKQFGERQFMVVAGKLDSFIDGLNRAPPPQTPPSDAHNL